MTPLPSNPTVVILLNADGLVQKVASNIALLPELSVVVTQNSLAFDQEALGKPFNQAVLPSDCNAI
jgi:hypothetical protein